MKKTNIPAFIIIIVTVCLFAVSYILLPDTVVTQVSLNGSSTKMPKLFALIIPALLGVVGAVMSLLIKGDKARGGKYLLVSAVGIAVFVIMLCVNL